MGDARRKAPDPRKPRQKRPAGPTALVVQPVELPAGETLDAPELDQVGFRLLGTCDIGPDELGASRDTPVVVVPTRVYVARYGDAYAFADPLDAAVRLRVVSVLASGRLVETRVLAPSRRGSVLDRIVAVADRSRLLARYPDRPAAGVRRELVGVDDLTTLWVTHRGFVRRVQGADDEVVDHGSLTLFAAAMQRAWAVRVGVDQPEGRRVARVTLYVRNVLLAVPLLVGIFGGLSLWAAALVAGVPAIGAVLVRDMIRRPPWRPWLLLVPLATAIFGGIAFGMAPAFATLILDLAVVALAETRLPGWVRAVLPAAVRGPASPPTPLVERS